MNMSERNVPQFLKKALYNLAIIVCMPIVILSRVIRPFFWVRYGYFTADRIGHFAFDVEYYLTVEAVQKSHRRGIDVFYLEGRPANLALFEIVKSVITISPCVRVLFAANQLLPGGDNHQIIPARHETDSRDFLGLMAQIGPQLSFSPTQQEMGRQFLKNIGLGPDDQYVCFAIRDNSYLNKTKFGRDWSYHDFRDTEIQDYTQAALALADKGYWVFRMGKVVEKSFGIEHAKIIDYASSTERDDFLDIWLMANCFFAVSSGLGLDSVADIFRRPIVFVNYLPLIDLEAWGPYLTVPKILYWVETGEPLSLYENIDHASLNGNYYQENGIRICDLKPDEVTEVVLEMHMRLTHSYKEDAIAEFLNQKFWNQLHQHPRFSKYHGWIHPGARLGAGYLKRTKNWLLEK